MPNYHKQKVVSLVAGISILSIGFLHAESPIYGYFWLRYTYENPTTPAVEENWHEFGIERGYIRLKTKTEPVSFSGTIDVTNKEDATNVSDWNFRLKYAQADWKLPFNSEYLPDAKLMLGLQKVYFGMMDLWEYPLIEKNLEEAEKKTSSADLGLGFHALLPKGFGEYSIQVFNGNGYTNVTENNTNKALCGNLSVIPLPGIMLKGSVWYAKAPQVIDTIEIQVDQNRYVGLGQFKYGPFTLITEVLFSKDYKTNGMGYSGFAEYNITKSLSLVGRYDSWDKNVDAQDDSHTRIILGTNYGIADNLLAQINYQLTRYEDPKIDARDMIMVQFKYSY